MLLSFLTSHSPMTIIRSIYLFVYLFHWNRHYFMIIAVIIWSDAKKSAHEFREINWLALWSCTSPPSLSLTFSVRVIYIANIKLTLLSIKTARNIQTASVKYLSRRKKNAAKKRLLLIKPNWNEWQATGQAGREREKGDGYMVWAGISTATAQKKHDVLCTKTKKY